MTARPNPIWIFLLLIRFCFVQANGAILCLEGDWTFRLDPHNQGIKERWFSTAQFSDRLKLPGCLQEQGIANTPGPGTVQPKKHYSGPAWYARSVEIPEEWAGSRIVLSLERCQGSSQLWIDGHEAGERDVLGVPHEYELTRLLNPGWHRLVLRVDNGRVLDVGGNAHNVSEQMALICNGIVGRLELKTTPTVWIDEVQVYPHLGNKSIQVVATVQNSFIGTGEGMLTVQARSFNTSAIHQVPARKYNITLRGQECRLEVDYPMGDEVQLWDELKPALYRAKISLYGVIGDRSVNHQVEVTFGMREFKIKGTQFIINHRPVLLRGNDDWAAYPKTGSVPMSIEDWRRTWAAYKDRGFNQARFHSWCPPEAAFAAADEAGIYLAPEVSEWNQLVSKEQEDFLRRESQAMLRYYGNHPSFVVMALGIESGVDQAIFQRLLTEWKKDPRRVYSLRKIEN